MFILELETKMADANWQEAMASETDAFKKEWMALERRYHLQLISEDAATQDKQVRLFLSLSDPELPTRLKGQVELQMILPGKYPVEAVHVNFTQWSSRLSQEQIIALNTAVSARAQQLCGSFSLRKLLTWIDNNFWRTIAPLEEDLEVQQGDNETITEEPKADDAAVSSEKKPKRRRGQRPCRFFARGNCRDGEKCKFSHNANKVKMEGGDENSGVTDKDAVREADPAQPPETEPATEPKKKKKLRLRKCKFFAQNKCRDGDKCKFSHEVKNTGENAKGQKLEAGVSPRAVVVQLGSSPVRKDAATAVESVKSTAVPSHSVNSETKHEDSDVWSETQQRALDLALKKYPASMDKLERWTSIANEVDGRSLNECIDRFKMLCELVRRGVDPTTVPVSQEEEKKEEAALEQTEIEDRVQNASIIPADKRITIETELGVKGTPICFEDLFLHEVGTLVAQQLVCQVQCANCPLTFDAVLRLDSPEIQKWCPRCSVLHHVLMRPLFAHSQSNVLAVVDTENCAIVDVLPTDVLATCLECGCEALLERVRPRQRSEQACFSCHVKLAVMAKRFVAGQVDGTSAIRSTSPDASAEKGAKSRKKGGKQVSETFVLGQPLPRNGACDHYKHSLRWFRFQCCGKAFPCDVCHDSSDCPEANLGKFASRMICGLCSKEQSSSVKVCSCGNDVAAKRTTSRHWEGGSGCRDSLQMSRWDKQKYRGQNKTESKKFKRVGAEAKRRQENAQQ
ncbi:Uncharacterized protein P3T76_000527 [Phytophthora citrophthora]|uniref:C3H1-type domain-containing protein n=1 Tax=Phytophthora citrophthora TaxID=4793 RepID=A0AAD9H0D3_9STRA|nr:Uncharacterized protein P3T76_000527 [Phytophthora citrophthora]